MISNGTSGRYFQLPAWTFLICWIVGLTLLSLVPSPPTPNVGFLSWDKFQHAAAFAVLTLLIAFSLGECVAGRTRRWAYAALFAIGYGAGIEIAQELFTVTRTAEWGDLVADFVGAGSVAVSVMITTARPKRNHPACIVGLSVLLLTATTVHAEVPKFFNLSTVKREAVRIRSEAGELVSYPLDTEDGGGWWMLAAAGATGLTYLLDYDIRDRVRERKSSSLDKAAKVGSAIGNPFAHLGVAAAFYVGGAVADSPKYREMGEMLGEAALLADASTLFLKQIIGRGRPLVTEDKGSFRPLHFRSDYDSLPSMHTSSSFAMASILAAASESWLTKLLYYGSATFVGFSRVYQDKHWASDIVLGAAIGELCGRVVMETHVRKEKAFFLSPAVSGDVVTLTFVSRW
ncbi:VanZ family protein [Geobacter sp. DSM 9736]|uniref:VanZ family protein n=1 Tax=Geobacter sp. DSM 9736 TaxID=1277350 RepID=UPI000B61CC30|nr:VanZ family protein [Geobacter sp. DSM 9736]SNB45568.1 PAP2 superfamily protein [Geobacter sp. DSM 9736]